jgi:hypothetical protein
MNGTAGALTRFYAHEGRVSYRVGSAMGAEQSDEASAHLAEAIRELRAVGDPKGAALLAKIAQRVDLIEYPKRHGGRHAAIRRTREMPFDPSA